MNTHAARMKRMQSRAQGSIKSQDAAVRARTKTMRKQMEKQTQEYERAMRRIARNLPLDMLMRIYGIS